MTGGVVTLGDTNEGTTSVDVDDPTGVEMICQQGILSDTLGTNAAGCVVEVGGGMINDETPKTGTKEGGGAGGVMVGMWSDVMQQQ